MTSNTQDLEDDSTSGEEDSPVLIAMAGLPATGKTQLARELAKRMDAALVPVGAIEEAIIGAGIWRNAATVMAAYRSAAAVARANLANGRSVVVDATNQRSESRAIWSHLAAELHVDHAFVVTTCSDKAEHQRRVQAQQPDASGQCLSWDQLIELNMETAFWGDEPRVTVDTAKDVDIPRVVALVKGLSGAERVTRADGPRTNGLQSDDPHRGTTTVDAPQVNAPYRSARRAQL